MNLVIEIMHMNIWLYVAEVEKIYALHITPTHAVNFVKSVGKLHAVTMEFKQMRKPGYALTTGLKQHVASVYSP